MVADATLTRAGLILTATGIASAATVRYAVDEQDGGAIFALGFFLYLGLILVAVPRRQSVLAAPLAFLGFAIVYFTGSLPTNANDIGVSLYIVAGALAYLATPRRFRAFTVAALALWTPAFRLFGPDPFGGAFPVSLAIASVLALFFLVVVLLARDAVDDEERLRRIGLGLLAVACVARIAERHLVVESRGIAAPDDVWALVVFAVLPVLVVLPARRGVRDALATGVALGAYILSSVALLVGKSYHVDSVAVVHRAAQLLVEGGNPYRDLDITEAITHFGLDPALATHFIDGTALHAYNYPALSFLIPAPFVALGLQDVRYLYLVEITIFVLILLRHARVPWRPLIVAAIVGNSVIVRQNVLAGVDPFWAIAALLAFVFIRHRWWSPVLIGLAIAARQPAWFFGPFYVLAVWKRAGRRQALRATGIAAIAAMLPNLPFLILSPADFVIGVTQPLLAELEPYGVGLIRFSMDGLVPFLPRLGYAALSLGAMALLLVLLARRWQIFRTGVVVFPSVVLWFAWRSLQNYFGFAAVFALSGEEDALPTDS